MNELNNGPTDEAINAFMQVRLRAFKNDKDKIGEIPVTYQGFKDAIILERKLELSNESLRKTDLTRWGILFEHLTHERERLYQLARREGEYAHVDVYRAYKKIKGVFNDPNIAIPFISMTEADMKSLQLTEEEGMILNTLNNSSKGYLEKTFYEDKASGKVYFTQAAVPAGVQTTPVTYTILNMFGCRHAIKNKGALSVDEVEGLTNVNIWITNMFYGLKKNMVEIVPFDPVNIIDVNPGLTNQQHPCY